MSLQSDFELCLEYAEALESKWDQRVQAQNNIIFIQNDGERLKHKLRICATLSVLSAIAILFLIFIVINTRPSTPMEVIPYFIVPANVFVVSFFNFIKTKKESDEVESKKSFLIQKYTAEFEECERAINILIKEIYEEDLLDIVPKDYFYASAIEFCLTQVRKRLANTATEAFQQLDAEIKRLEQMEYLEQMNYARMEQLNEIKRAIDINTLVTLVEHEKDNY